MKRDITVVAGSIVSLALTLYAAHLLKSIQEATGWAAVGLFLLGAILLVAGLGLFCKMDKVMSKM